MGGQRTNPRANQRTWHGVRQTSPDCSYCRAYLSHPMPCALIRTGICTLSTHSTTYKSPCESTHMAWGAANIAGLLLLSGLFAAPHAMCVDSHGDLYVVEWVDFDEGGLQEWVEDL